MFFSSVHRRGYRGTIEQVGGTFIKVFLCEKHLRCWAGRFTTEGYQSGTARLVTRKAWRNPDGSRLEQNPHMILAKGLPSPVEQRQGRLPYLYCEFSNMYGDAEPWFWPALEPLNCPPYVGGHHPQDLERHARDAAKRLLARPVPALQLPRFAIRKEESGWFSDHTEFTPEVVELLDVQQYQLGWSDRRNSVYERTPHWEPLPYLATPRIRLVHTHGERMRVPLTQPCSFWVDPAWEAITGYTSRQAPPPSSYQLKDLCHTLNLIALGFGSNPVPLPR